MTSHKIFIRAKKEMGLVSGAFFYFSLKFMFEETCLEIIK